MLLMHAIISQTISLYIYAPTYSSPYTTRSKKPSLFIMATINEHCWLEPIVPVQMLSNSGVPTVPQQYIKPPFERPCGSITRMNCPDLSIPIIDLACFSDIPEHRKAVLEAIGEACKNWGFFQVVNHGVGIDSVKRMREAWREFFDLPMEEKKLYANSPVTYEGYGSRLGVEKGATLDWSDYYFLNLLPNDMKNLEKWPEMPRHLR